MNRLFRLTKKMRAEMNRAIRYRADFARRAFDQPFGSHIRIEQKPVIDERTPQTVAELHRRQARHERRMARGEAFPMAGIQDMVMLPGGRQTAIYLPYTRFWTRDNRARRRARAAQ